MSVVPVVPTFSTGIPASSTLNALAAALTWAQSPPKAVLRSAAAQSIPNTTWTSLTWDTEDDDSVDGHSTSSNPSRYTAVYAGWYLVNGVYAAAANATSKRMTRWAVNGTAVTSTMVALPPVTVAANGTACPAVGKLVYLGIGDYVELQAWQGTGGALLTDVAFTDGQSGMSVLWISR